MMTVTAGYSGRRRRSLWRGVILTVVVLCSAGVVLAAVAWARINRADGVLVSAGEKRSYLLHVPASYDSAKPVPLVIAMHGFASWPAHQMEMSRWNDLADRHGFIVVYPSGVGFPKRWRAYTQGSEAPSADMRDVMFIADLIDALSSRYNIDRTRVYANGLSNGGGMSFLLACKLADRIAAAGGVAGAYTFPLSECRPARPVPFIVFHGTADTIVPYNGGRSGPFPLPFPALPAWVAGLAHLNGCAPTATALPARGEVSGIRYSGCRNNADVVFYTIEGGGHTWPGGVPMARSIVGHTTQDIDATTVLWEFFRQYAL